MCISVNVATILDIVYRLVFSKHLVAVGASHLMTEIDPVARKVVFEENTYNGKCAKSQSRFEAVDPGTKFGFSCQIVCTLSKPNVIILM